MKRTIILILSLFFLVTMNSHSAPSVSISVSSVDTHVQEQENGDLSLNVSDSDAAAFQSAGHVRYSDFGAIGDGQTDDSNAIAATHAYANQSNLKVQADAGATYYIGGRERKAIVQTDTNFGDASFIIDDTEVENKDAPIFEVRSKLKAFELKGLTSLRRNQKRIRVDLPGPCLITVTDSDTKRYIRYGLNQNNGSAQTDIFVVDKNGKLDRNAPIIWDFEQITDCTAIPIDEENLSIIGGKFTTIANQDESKYNYYDRNLTIRRSNVIVDGLEHRVIGEGEQGAPYGGFINIRDSSYVTVKNTILTGRKTYATIGSAGKPVKMGSYDIIVNRSLNVSFINCSQTNDIHDRTYWGVMSSNFSKNLLYDNCTLSRFDAHMGVANATIRNSTLGHMGINAIGTGTLTLENSSVHGYHLINLRPDYGSTWEGTIVVSDCRFVPANGWPIRASLIGGRNSTQHDFGYTCYLPEKIVIKNLEIDDSNHPDSYDGPAIFSDFTPEMAAENFHETHPYVRPKKVLLRTVTTASGKSLRLSDNPQAFEGVKVITRKR
ncbi:hypothetical protein [Pelagicoccus sp. SDUM812002]|uniref:hypothetical protein n=1 Tax=Pelagicoccus sp. SDUM812002 TaxID=3041266 RepID=UPI00280FEAAF|nr:hypothetical protein [Pelagicoccus sp. SDUM812002]MDQ8185782.1 hypothetical protein [Pelagicoccus sp. SDUM812002]